MWRGVPSREQSGVAPSPSPSSKTSPFGGRGGEAAPVEGTAQFGHVQGFSPA